MCQLQKQFGSDCSVAEVVVICSPGLRLSFGLRFIQGGVVWIDIALGVSRKQNVNVEFIIKTTWSDHFDV